MKMLHARANLKPHDQHGYKSLIRARLSACCKHPGVRSSSQSGGLAEWALECWNTPRAKHTQRTAPERCCSSSMTMEKALGLCGGLCHRYAVPPSRHAPCIFVTALIRWRSPFGQPAGVYLPAAAFDPLRYGSKTLRARVGAGFPAASLHPRVSLSLHRA